MPSKNPEVHRRAAANYRKRHPDRVKAYKAKFLKENPEWRVWSMMRQRCNNPKNHKYRIYGARGIKVCERWAQYKNFLADMGHRPGPEYSIDRINNDGNYEPGNCRWATAKEQRANQRPYKRKGTNEGTGLCISLPAA